jgi:hypothetical protein
LHSEHAKKPTDDGLANRLASVSLSEQLSASATEQLFAEIPLGPKAAEQLHFLAAFSNFRPPPPSENLNIPAPEDAEQKRLLESATDYAHNAIHQLPDFLATRVTRSFNNDFQDPTAKKRSKIARLHWASEHHREISYRNGHEDLGNESRSEGFTTWGEFGPILDLLFSNLSNSHSVWNRWEKTPTGKLIAVFQYSVPKSASHYLIDFCCYRTSESSGWLSFHDMPAYHGNVSVDSVTGIITKITIQADLEESSALKESGMEVEYGTVNIGGKEYTCPLHGTTILTVQMPDKEANTGFSLRKYINEVSFVNYHKFGSTVRIMP